MARADALSEPRLRIVKRGHIILSMDIDGHVIPPEYVVSWTATESAQDFATVSVTFVGSVRIEEEAPSE